MQEEERAELARQEGAELRVTSVSLLADGSVRLAGFDMGPAVEEFWGDEDYEFWVRVPTEAVARLGFLLLREKYAGCADASSANSTRSLTSSTTGFELVPEKIGAFRFEFQAALIPAHNRKSGQCDA